VLLFVFAVSTLEWERVVDGAGLAAVLLLARFVVKAVSVAAFAHVSGITWRKGLLTGIALSPMSVFVTLLLEQTKYMGIVLVDELAALAAMTLLLEVVGPVITQRALHWANETPKEENNGIGRIQIIATAHHGRGAGAATGQPVGLRPDRVQPGPAASVEPQAFPGNVTPEITESMIEINSDVHTNHTELVKQLQVIRDTLVQAGEQLNIGICGGGTHPFQKWSERRIFSKPRFKEVSELYGYLAKQFTIFGQHVHIGCASGDDALFLLHALSRYVPHFIALSSSSPYVQGNDTLFNSAPELVFAFPMSGRAPFTQSWSTFEHEYFAKMEHTGVIKSMKDFTGISAPSRNTAPSNCACAIRR
jgi:hypothetical protein